MSQLLPVHRVFSCFSFASVARKPLSSFVELELRGKIATLQVSLIHQYSDQYRVQSSYLVSVQLSAGMAHQECICPARCPLETGYSSFVNHTLLIV